MPQPKNSYTESNSASGAMERQASDEVGNASMYPSTLYSMVTKILTPMKRGRPPGSKDSKPRRKPGELQKEKRPPGEVKRGRPRGSKDQGPRQKKRRFPNLLEADFISAFQNYVDATNAAEAGNVGAAKPGGAWAPATSVPLANGTTMKLDEFVRVENGRLHVDYQKLRSIPVDQLLKRLGNDPLPLDFQAVKAPAQVVATQAAPASAPSHVASPIVVTPFPAHVHPKAASAAQSPVMTMNTQLNLSSAVAKPLEPLHMGGWHSSDMQDEPDDGIDRDWIDGMLILQSSVPF